MKIYYKFGLSDEIEFEISDLFSLTRKIEQESIAEICAKDYFFNHKGKNEIWPLLMTLMDENKNIVSFFDIYIEYEPSFIAMKRR